MVSVQLVACRFTANAAATGWGGAMYVRGHRSPGSSLDIVNSSFVSNTAAANNTVGGAVAVFNSTFETYALHNSTFEGNTAGLSGGGIHLDGSSGAVEVGDMGDGYGYGRI